MSRCKNNAVKELKAHSLEQAADVLVEKFPLYLNPEQTLLARNLQMEAAKIWNAACNIHRTIYGRYGYWLNEGAIKALLKGKYGLHSQSVQAVVETYFECCERTRELHLQGHTEWKYPYRRKRFFTVTWKKAAITHKGRILKLSNGWGREPLMVKLPQRLASTAILQAQLVWHRNQYWLHVTVEKPALLKVQGDVCAAIDPGEVHALTITDGDDALVISGRLLRSLNRLRNKVLRQLQRAISKTKEGSRKRRKLLAKKYRFLNWIERRIEHILHAISANAVRWCLGRSVKTVYIGNPEGVRERDCGRHHNQRMGQWALGKLRDLLAYKLKRHGTELIQVDERGTSGTCPVCGEYTRQTGRVYRCGNASCGFTGIHRDVLGASGILDKALYGSFTRGRRLPGKVEYLRPQVLAPKRAA
ncbi:IS200/IS605 family element transposase accessory protein TnpB [Desulfofundulus sp. TPOSR]|uniref:RNA-guided endonuclease InsQ/TnpB family protein n=1 Tax=Desulfofundulus sp. TPOSR TaxID=2714340 RepID=UPI00140DBD1E|nr:RNA-guided endonuclease TnpB family protein [Desulfofundulus sp. TPOSR]NHM28795.1 IS200/IS605 family element transposase accessory protein TnpB [Desulfofundulus sp. TPOSR]